MNKLFIDISDLLIYAVRNRRITGIQRVEISFLNHLIANRSSYKLVNSLGLKPWPLDSIIRSEIRRPDELLSKLAYECGHLAPSNFLQKLRRFSRDVSVRLFGAFNSLAKMHEGDILFVPGAFWLDLSIIDFYRAAAEKGVKLVVLLHDVLPITHPHLMVEGSDQFFGPILTLPIHVITGAKYTQDDLPRATELFEGARMPLSSKVVAFAHEFPGVIRNQPPRRPSSRLRRIIGNRSFALYVSTVEVRKNHLRLFEVWTKLAHELGPKLPVLLIAGKQGWEAEDAISWLMAANARHEKGSLDEPILFVEGPSDAELQWLYASCDFTVFPSLAEGWGLPVGESLWFGKVCAASNATSIPEVGRDLCVYYDPEDPRAIEAGIRTLLDPSVRADYESKIRAAHLRTWHEAARDLAAAVLEHVSQEAPHGAGASAPAEGALRL